MGKANFDVLIETSLKIQDYWSVRPTSLTLKMKAPRQFDV